jgi:predicted amidohydrolase
VLPELALTGFPVEGSSCSDQEQTAVELLMALAREHSTLIVTSVVQEEGASLYNTVMLVGSAGVVARHRKRHLARDDLPWASPGDAPFDTVDTSIGRIGLLAGYDALFWESLRVLATLGADLICVAAALRWPIRAPLGNSGQDWVYWRTKAWESCAGLAIANYPGPDFAGTSGIFIPDVRDDRGKESVAGDTGAALVCETLDTSSRYIREKRSLGWRRLHWYKPLVAPAQSARPDSPQGVDSAAEHQPR